MAEILGQSRWGKDLLKGKTYYGIKGDNYFKFLLSKKEDLLEYDAVFLTFAGVKKFLNNTAKNKVKEVKEEPIKEKSFEEKFDEVGEDVNLFKQFLQKEGISVVCENENYREFRLKLFKEGTPLVSLGFKVSDSTCCGHRDINDFFLVDSAKLNNFTTERFVTLAKLLKEDFEKLIDLVVSEVGVFYYTAFLVHNARTTKVISTLFENCKFFDVGLPLENPSSGNDIKLCYINQTYIDTYEGE